MTCNFFFNLTWLNSALSPLAAFCHQSAVDNRNRLAQHLVPGIALGGVGFCWFILWLAGYHGQIPDRAGRQLPGAASASPPAYCASGRLPRGHSTG